ncbi:PAS domain S-box-containing protein [Rhizobium tibeticum]|uniref:hybrid sensor histidine kinase/response regulator n=1 Tax=Rhizobium tibeticum TaxID=501024 RepID=UPI00277DA57D|nr:PAS domain-containing sensor histidine kinase [Rhizobium tibeticum]MDP9812305.1 PAS domain S-box-containing protein [Rhizobium tibeticum]
MTVESVALRGHTVEERYRLLVDAISDYAIYMLDPDGYISSWNAGAHRFKGYTEGEILGQHFSRFYTSADRDARLPQRALHTAATEGRFEAEGWRVRKDGSRFWAHVIIDAIRDPKGQLIGFAKITRDLTARKQTEEVLKSSEEQFRLLVQGVVDYAIYMLDPQGYVSSWNLGAQRIKGYAPEEIIGQHFSKFYTDEDKAQNLPKIALENAEREGRFEKEGWRIRKDGTRFWANVIIDAIHADDGRLIGFAKITRDITEKRQAEETLQRAQQELFQAQKMEALGQLTGGVAHDFNNLLTAILGSLEIAQKRAAVGKDVTELIKNAIQGARRGASLTQRLLAFSRKQELTLEAVDIPTLVRGMAEMLRRSIGPTIEINTSFPLALSRVHSDPNQLESALLNLALNARDAMPKGGSVVIAAKEHWLAVGDVGGLKPGHYVCLSVADDGEGMDVATLESATTPFFTTKGLGKGTGLGLPMVQGLMAQSGGSLVLRSSTGVGTTAELWLPVAEHREPDQTKTEVAPKLETSLSVLVVDDDPLVLTNAALMIEDLGHAAVEAQSAEEALKLLSEENDFDLVVTDHAMPKMTGAELAALLRESHPHLPVILATGYADLPNASDRDLVRLPKPFSQAQLNSSILAAVLDRK